MKLFLEIDNDMMKFCKKNFIKEKSYENEKINDSYQLYNTSIDMIKTQCFTSAMSKLILANSINEHDEEIGILLGLVYIKFSKFDSACEKLYNSYDSGVELSKKYTDILISEEFKSFLEYYNIGIKAINEKKYEFAIDIFNKIINEEPQLIEPYIYVYSLYDLKKYEKEKEEFINLIKTKDKDNEILNSIYKDVKEDSEIILNDANKKKFKSKAKFIIIPLVMILPFLIFDFKYSNINNKEEIENKINNPSNVENIGNSEKSKDKEDKDNIEIIKSLGLSNDQLLKQVKVLKSKDNYKEAIDVYKVLIDLTENNDKMLAEYIYQIAYISEHIEDYSQAIEYYKKYIENYSISYPYYDESYYNMSMIYYKTNRIDQAKTYLSQFVIKNPESIYNNSKVKEIINMD